MLAHAFLAVTTADERDQTPRLAGLIPLTVNKFRRLFDARDPCVKTDHDQPHQLVNLATKTPSTSPRMPLPKTRTTMITNYGCSANGASPQPDKSCSGARRGGRLRSGRVETVTGVPVRCMNRL